jgi:transcriptional regulator with GAF, ATPase, and Fis domain
VYRWVHGRALPTRDADGRITRWYSLVTDIEERKHAKEKLEKALAEIKLLKDQLVKENIALRDEIDRVSMFEEIVGTSQALQAVLSRVIKVAPTDSSVLITGETGTGKNSLHAPFTSDPRGPSGHLSA